jgi:20S proteasome alpha/beta subunit
MSGFVADARTLVDHARVETQVGTDEAPRGI